MPHKYIKLAEKKYRKLLTEECRMLFSGTFMPSHDHLHHERVWKNASALLERMYNAGMIVDPLMAEKAIIASFFHDTGLIINRGAGHGTESRLICSRFMENCNLGEEDRNEILEAVERHDDKNYQTKSDPSSLAAVVSVADDMDAFGPEGVERYIEIYSMRGIPADKMPEMITENAASRFRHLASTYSMFPNLVEEQKKRFETVLQYFQKPKDEKK
jgi:HD superfamily phosphodiesterase